MELLKQILIIAIASNAFADAAKQFRLTRIKPLNCEKCMAFWFSLILLYSTLSIRDLILFSFVSYYLAFIVNQIIFKLFKC